jgi:hypothetical protein
MIGSKAHSRNKSNDAQLCLFAWAETHLTTVPVEPDFLCNEPVLRRCASRTGWSLARCRATIEANGGRLYV